MKIPFVKMHGAGNDYIYFDCMETPAEQIFSDISAAAVRLSDRHKGIGGDGVVLICKSDVADAQMRMFNADGSEGKMCGNAIRCVGKYLYDSGATDKLRLKIQTLAGIKELYLHAESGSVTTVTVDMGRAELNPELIPVAVAGGRCIDRPVEVGGRAWRINAVSMGNPHCVIFADPDMTDVETVGKLFENAPIFPDRVNTEFIKVIGKNKLKMRVWERGSGETMACGTGACAAAVAAVECGFADAKEEITVLLRGGELTIRYCDERVLMTGAAELVFAGVLETEGDCKL